mgnify:CR=1 FL=1
MSIFDNGNWELVSPLVGGKRPARDSIHLTISNKQMKLSREAVKVMGSPTQVDVWIATDSGRLLFINQGTDGRKTKDGAIHCYRKELISKVMEHLILYGSVKKYIEIERTYFCVEGKEFKEQDPKDQSKWLHGVEFDLANAYYCQKSWKKKE